MCVVSQKNDVVFCLLVHHLSTFFMQFAKFQLVCVKRSFQKKMIWNVADNIQNQTVVRYFCLRKNTLCNW